MAKKPKVSLRPVVDAIEELLKELEGLDEPADAKAKHAPRRSRRRSRGRR